VLPAADVSQTELFAQHPSIAVVRNASDLQAVSHQKQGIHYAVFHKPGSVNFPRGIHLATEDAALFLLKSTSGGRVQVTVADPTRKLDHITFRLASTSGTDTTLTVQLPQGPLAGKSLQLDPVPAVPTTFFLHSDTL